MSSLLRAWYVTLALGLATFLVVAFVGRVPAELSAAVALPHELLHRAGVNLRLTLESAVDRRELRDELALLQQRLAEAESERRRLELELERLDEVLAVRSAQAPGVWATAPVIGGDAGPDVSRLRVGLGADAGVQLNMPVTVPAGLVGIVTEVTRRSAVVRTVLDSQSRVGVTVRGRGGQGIAVGEVGGLVRVTRFIVDDPVAVGDVVETSSYGGLFPAGLLVGVVEQVLPPDPNELRRSFLVRPGVDLATVRDVVLLSTQ